MSMQHHPKSEKRHVDIDVDRVAKIYAQAVVEAADAGALARHRRGADVVDRDRGSVRLFSES